MPMRAQRGSPVIIGNVYVCNRAPAFRDFRVVVGMIEVPRRPWNNIVLTHYDKDLNVVGCSRVPEVYCREHWDLVGHATVLTTLKIDWVADPQEALQRKRPR